jgi:hypothetical protein
LRAIGVLLLGGYTLNSDSTNFGEAHLDVFHSHILRADVLADVVLELLHPLFAVPIPLCNARLFHVVEPAVSEVGEGDVRVRRLVKFGLPQQETELLLGCFFVLAEPMELAIHRAGELVVEGGPVDFGFASFHWGTRQASR